MVALRRRVQGAWENTTQIFSRVTKMAVFTVDLAHFWASSRLEAGLGPRFSANFEKIAHRTANHSGLEMPLVRPTLEPKRAV